MHVVCHVKLHIIACFYGVEDAFENAFICNMTFARPGPFFRELREKTSVYILKFFKKTSGDDYLESHGAADELFFRNNRLARLNAIAVLAALSLSVNIIVIIGIIIYLFFWTTEYNVTQGVIFIKIDRFYRAVGSRHRYTLYSQCVHWI